MTHLNIAGRPLVVDSGQTIAPGEPVKLPARVADHDQALIDAGQLTPLADVKAAAKAAAKKEA